MTKEQLTSAYNIVIKYGFCGDCKWVHDSDKCHKQDCYVNAVSVIQEAIRKAYESEKGDLTLEEKCILKRFGSGYIARDDNGKLYGYKNKPEWYDAIKGFDSSDEISTIIKGDIFKFINKGECYSFLVQSSGEVVTKNASPIAKDKKEGKNEL